MPKRKNIFLVFTLLELLLVVIGAVTALEAGEKETSDYQTIYVDELNLALTECGYRKTGSRKTIDGNPLRVDGKTYPRGVGHHAPGRIMIELPGTKGRFSCEVGIDDEVGDRGHAEFLVYGNDPSEKNLLWRSGFLTGKDTPKLCDVAVDGLGRIILVMDTGPEGYAHDHGDWLDAKITIEGTPEQGRKIRTISPSLFLFDSEGRTISRDDEYACEFLSLQNELKTGIPENRAAQALRPESTFYKTDRDPVDVVFRRTKAMLENLKLLPGAPDFTGESETIGKFEDRNTKTPAEDTAARRSLFREIAAHRDRIALKNPLLTFRDVLFIKRHVTPEPEKRGNHMCDQFFGFHAVPGGGLFVLKNAFEPEKRTVENFLENTAVSTGRLKGKKLDETWGYLSPTLSYDGNTILFAATDTSEPRHSYQWTVDNCYHIFQVDRGGSKLAQLTDGAWNDFDPYFLPSGRIVFISERRGGYGRCHARPCPSYTLHSMLPDGNDIVALSPHETNEWAPTVDRNGMIVYTRWDYVDRGFNQAHHPWITYPDGRDPRAIQGNYSEVEQSRPHFETSFKPIADSHRLLGTAQGHHTQYFGSVILLDPNVPDDEEGGDPMAPLRRVTPEQPFPESECQAHRDPANYGQPFPLNEDYYLVVYDPFSGMGKGHANSYGIYLLDSFGNKTLLYRDHEISCQCPIPLAPRPSPPVVPHQTLVGLPPGVEAPTEQGDDKNLPNFGVVSVTNVYETNRPFPEGAKIKELRVVQVLPKTTWNCNDPWIGYGNENGARKVLGTVPVEPDGSVRFEMPVDVPVYFQALDEHGVAVQTMRSATYVKPGEMLTCLGCHEGRQRSTARPTTYPVAFRKEPAKIQPEMAGSNPFNYPRLIQPILDRHCVECHAREAQAGKTFRLDRGDTGKHFFESYRNLRAHVFVFASIYRKNTPIKDLMELRDPLPSNGHAYNAFTVGRTMPGQFGTHASPLWHLLKKGHYDVSLSPLEWRSLALWLDNNADFYGAYEYESIEPQKRGEIVRPTLE